MTFMLMWISFVSGIILLFAPIVIFLSIKGFLYTFNSEQTLSYIIFLIVSILEAVFFIKLFKAYCLREPHAYYLVYFLGIFAILGMFAASLASLLETYQYLHIIKIIFFFVLLFALFSFHYQKEIFITASTTSWAKNTVLTFLILAIVISIVSYYISVSFIIPGRFISSYFLTALISFALVPWWRKKVSNKILRNFIFLPGFCLVVNIIVVHLVFQRFIFYYFLRIFDI